MLNQNEELAALIRQAEIRREVERLITHSFAHEDGPLQFAIDAAKRHNLPQIQISPVQGKFLQLLAVMCNARKILEIGSLAGYSGIWLARALPLGGHLITLELNPKHAQVVREVFAQAGMENVAEVREGRALDLLPQLQHESPFDLIFIDADMPSYPHYLDWALRLSRPGSIIAADNCILAGRVYNETTDEGRRGIVEYINRISSDPGLMALAIAMDDDYTDGFAIAVVRY
jgi:caffeoyl-CoA O-methyltransferase